MPEPEQEEVVTQGPSLVDEAARRSVTPTQPANEAGVRGDSPASLAELVSSDKYRGLGPNERLSRMSEFSDDFRLLMLKNPNAAQKFATGLDSKYEPQPDVIEQDPDREDPGVIESFMGGWDLGIGALQIAGANAAMLIEMAGIENDYDDSWRKAAEINFLDGGQQIGSDWYDQVAAILGGLPGGLAVPGLATAGIAIGLGSIPVTAAAAPFVAPIIGFGLSGALAVADQGPEAALKRGAVDALLGTIYPVTASLGRPIRMALETGAAYAISEETDENRRWIQAVSLGMIAGAPGKRAPFEVMKKLGVKDRFAEAHAARIEARNTQDRNVASVTAQHQLVSDKYGVPIGNLQDLFRVYGEMVRNEHPMMGHPKDRSPYEVDRIRNRDTESEADRRTVNRDEQKPINSEDGRVPQRTNAAFRPGPHFVDKRGWNVGEGILKTLFKKYKKAGEILYPVAKAFGIPMHVGVSRAWREQGTRGWYQERTRRLQVDSETNVQTAAHEFGHDLSFEDPVLNAMHNMRDPNFRNDLNRLDEVAAEHGVGPEVIGDKGDVGFSGVMVDPDTGRATVSGIFKLWQDGKIPEDLRYIAELLSVSYDRDNVTEGMAEMMRLYFTNNKKFGGKVDLSAGGFFPESMKRIEAWHKSLPRAKRRALDRFQKEAHEHLNMSAEVAANTTFGPSASPAGVLSTRMAVLRQSLTDDLSGIHNLIQKTYGGEMVPDSVYETFRLLRGQGEAADGIVNFGVPTLVRDTMVRGKDGKLLPSSEQPRMMRYVGKSIQERLAPVATSGAKLDRFFKYSVARQSLELRMQTRDKKGRVVSMKHWTREARERRQREGLSRENLWDNEMIEKSLALADAEHKVTYEAVFKELQEFAEGMADLGEGAGLWSRDQRNGWHRTQYIFSFFREMEAHSSTVRNAAILTGSTPFYTARGSTKNLKDPFSLLLESHSRTYKLAMENAAKQELVRFLTLAQGGGRWHEMLKLKPKMKDFKFDEIRDAIKSELVAKHPFLQRMRESDPGAFEKKINQMLKREFPNTEDLEKVTLFLGNTKPHGDNVMTVYNHGKPTYYDINDPMLVRAIQGMRRPQLVGLEKTMNWMRKFKQRFITMAPGFMVANFARDTAMASIMSRTGNFHLGKALGGAWSAALKDQHYQDFVAQGGGGAGIRDKPQVTRRSVIKHAQRKSFNPKAVLITPGDVGRFIDEIGRIGEVASRLGEYKAARKQGAGAMHAAYLGREVSTDFGMRGDNPKMNFMANTVPFFNAMVQGGDRLFRGVLYDPSHKKNTAMKIGMLGVGSMGLYMMNRELPEYRDLPDWDKNSYWHFFLPKWTDDGEREKYTEGSFAGQLAHEHFKMPKLWEVGVIATMGERMLESMLGDKDSSVVELGIDMGEMIMQNFGVHMDQKAFPLPLPVGIGTAVEQYGNRILFTGNPIESQAMANQEAWHRGKASRPRVFGEWGKLTERWPIFDSVKSPARAEALLRGVFGEFAMYGAHLADSVFFPGGPSIPFDKMPVVSRFYEGPEKYSKQASEFYDRFNRMKQASATMNAMMGNPADYEKLQEWANDPHKMMEIQLKEGFARQAAVIAQLSKHQDMIRSGVMDLTSDEASARLREIGIEKTILMRAMNETVDRIEKEYK